jgi:hypothetical protein
MRSRNQSTVERAVHPVNKRAFADAHNKGKDREQGRPLRASGGERDRKRGRRHDCTIM